MGIYRFVFKVIRYGRGLLFHVKTHLAPRWRRRRRLEQLSNGFEQSGDGFVVAVEAFSQLGKLLREFFVRGSCSRSKQSAHDPHARFDGHRAVQHAGQHDGAVLVKNPRRSFDALRAGFEITDCDIKAASVLSRKLQREVRGESL